MNEKYQDAIEEDFTPEAALKPYKVTVFIVMLIIALKLYAYAMSNSASMLGSLIDSAGDITITLCAFFAIRLSLKPADKNHRYGHGKVEGFSTLLQGCFLGGAAFFLLFETGNRLFFPVTISHQLLGILVSLITIFLTCVIVYLQQKAYNSSQSLALKADQQHYTGDILLNTLVIVSFATSWIESFEYMDTIFGVGIAVYLFKTAKDLGVEAFDMLMDAEIDDEDRQKIIDIVINNKNVFGIHDLRTRKSGMHIHISFDVELEGSLSLEAAHEITRELDFEILKSFPNAEIIIHKDPKGDTYDPRHKVSGVHD